MTIKQFDLPVEVGLLLGNPLDADGDAVNDDFVAPVQWKAKLELVNKTIAYRAGPLAVAKEQIVLLDTLGNATMKVYPTTADDPADALTPAGAQYRFSLHANGVQFETILDIDAGDNTGTAVTLADSEVQNPAAPAIDGSSVDARLNALESSSLAAATARGQEVIDRALSDTSITDRLDVGGDVGDRIAANETAIANLDVGGYKTVAALPADDTVEGATVMLSGHATIPDGLYSWTGHQWAEGVEVPLVGIAVTDRLSGRNGIAYNAVADGGNFVLMKSPLIPRYPNLFGTTGFDVNLQIQRDIAVGRVRDFQYITVDHYRSDDRFGGGGSFRYSATAGTDDNATVINLPDGGSLIAQFDDGPVDVSRWGVTSGSAQTDTAALIQAAVDFAADGSELTITNPMTTGFAFTLEADVIVNKPLTIRGVGYPTITGGVFDLQHPEAHLVQLGAEPIFIEEQPAGFASAFEALCGVRATPEPIPTSFDETITVTTPAEFIAAFDTFTPGPAGVRQILIDDSVGLNAQWNVTVAPETDPLRNVGQIWVTANPANVRFIVDSHFKIGRPSVVFHSINFSNIWGSAPCIRFDSFDVATHQTNPNLRADNGKVLSCNFISNDEPLPNDHPGANIQFAYGADNGEVADCEFSGSIGQLISAASIDPAVDPEGKWSSRNCHFHHNKFRDTPVMANGGTAINLGDGYTKPVSYDDWGGHIVEYNEWLNLLHDPEIVSFKSCGNIARYNSVVLCPDTSFTFRQGDYNAVYGNVLRGSSNRLAAFTGTGNMAAYNIIDARDSDAVLYSFRVGDRTPDPTTPIQHYRPAVNCVAHRNLVFLDPANNNFEAVASTPIGGASVVSGLAAGNKINDLVAGDAATTVYQDSTPSAMDAATWDASNKTASLRSGAANNGFWRFVEDPADPVETVGFVMSRGTHAPLVVAPNDLFTSILKS